MKSFIVYGTLRPGHHNYDWALAGRTIAEETITVTDARLTSNGGFPYLIPTVGETSEATLVTVADDMYEDVLGILDELEGYVPGSRFNLYRRVVKTVAVASGETVEAWLYIPADEMLEDASNLRPVPGNNWNLEVTPDPAYARRSQVSLT